ncbi:MAG: MG2 domain-containing protein [Proteobacteria bacterium]|nr:MG2 domain-containing protein [Pseudomonadota bacterium]
MHSRAQRFAQNAAALGLFMAALFCGLSCGGKKSTQSRPGSDVTRSDRDRVMLQQEKLPDGLALRLSDGKDGPYQPVRVKPAVATELSGDEANALLGRLSPLAGTFNDKKSFALRDRSRPAPRTGKSIAAKFPPDRIESGAEQPGRVTGQTTSELRVVRWAPEGNVPLVPHLSVTFSQPMVAVTGHTDTVARGVPVKLTPTPTGNWRWVGTRTLLFDPDPRFPQATEYRVEIAAGTRSQTGATLAEASSFTFKTPPPRVVQSHPTTSPQPRDPAMFILFDQAVDAPAVLETIVVRAGAETYPVRALSEREIAENPAIKSLVESAAKEQDKPRHVAFRPAARLPVDTHIEVVVGPGTPSAEGPRKTESAQSFSFRTYAPLAVEQARCSYGSSCPPMTPWTVRFNNPLDVESFDAESIRISPRLPGYRADANGRYLHLRGRSKGRTTYTVTLPGELTDRFGQALGKSESLTFQVGDANPSFWGPQGLVVLDPTAKKRTLDVFTTNIKAVKVRLYRVTPRDWDAFAAYMRRPYSHQNRQYAPNTPPGTQIADTVIEVSGETDEMVETAIDLSPALASADGTGHVVVVAEPTPWTRTQRPPMVHAWVQATQIGLDAFVDDTELIAWATRLSDGEPLSGVSLEIAPFGTSASSDERGMARMPLSAPKSKGRHLLLARKGNDSAILPERLTWWGRGGSWSRRDPGQSLRWYVFDDRAMYKPGEEVHIKGWVRRIDNREGGDLIALGGAVDQVSYTVFGPRGNEILKDKISVNALGGFDSKFTLPKTPNLGWARIEMKAVGRGAVNGRTHNHSFQIQEFRRPEFEVNVQASQGPHVVGSSADVTVKAKYYAGGGLPGAQVNWHVTAQPGSFTPPNRDDYTFGTWVPWWGWHRWAYPGPTEANKSYSHQGKTDATGKHVVRVDFLSVKPPRPMQVTAQATVMDVNRQAWSANAGLLVHPSELYVGLKRDKYFVEKGQPIELEGIVVDHDGKAVAGKPVSLRAVRMDWAWKKGKYVTEERDPQECERMSENDSFSCSFDTAEGGQYKITAQVVDDRGRTNHTELTYWVSGGEQPAAREVELEQVTLIPDKKQYRPGDTAEILIQSPFAPAEGILSIRRSGIVSTQRFTLKDRATTVVTVPIRQGHIPNVHVQVDIVGSAMRLDDQGVPVEKLPRRPALATGQLNLAVPAASRTLQVNATPRDRKLAPGEKTQIDISVRDAGGEPVSGAEVAVIVVDESVLSLSNYQLADPIEVFYAQRPSGARDHHLRQSVKLARPDADAFDIDVDELADSNSPVMLQSALADNAEAEGVVRGVAGARAEAPPDPEAAPLPKESARFSRAKGKALGRVGGGQSQAPIAVRSNFNALATFAPRVQTDAQGRAAVDVNVPDNLTRYRVMAVAVVGDRQFGKGESSITARRPLMVRPSAPRFLNFGDRFDLPVVVQNQTDEAMAVRVAVRATNAQLTAGLGRALSVPANDRVEIRFPAAAEMAGTARFQVAAAAGGWSDASEFALPVWSPATTEAFATYGEIDRGAIRQPVALPGNVVEQFGGLDITTSSTQLQALTDAFLYLVQYPYECAEQVSSRVLAVAALSDVLDAFGAAGLPPRKEIDAAMVRDIEKLRGMQNPDGGFGWWRPGNQSWPYLSIHVANALNRAKANGFRVSASSLDRSKQYMRNVEKYIPRWYPDRVRWTLIAYALHTRKAMGDVDTARARQLIRQAGADKLPLDALGWLLGVLSGDRSSAKELAQIHRHLQNRVTETAAAANFVTSYSDGGHLILHSSRRADGIILESLIADKPKSDLIAKLVRGLLGHRKRGRWGNTQENAFVLLALDRYFKTYENVTPNFVARAWLGDGYAGEHRFRGRTTDRHHIDVPMKYLADIGKGDVVLHKDGRGRMYYRIGMTYAPASLTLDPADHGFAVARRYEAVDDPGDVSRLDDGTWKIKAGTRVRVRLTMVAENRRYHVALVDPLPAGLEAMNPALAVTGAIPQDPSAQKQGPYWWWQRTWYEHQNMRDERIEAFASLLWAGVHEYTYVARATTPGNYVVPPAKAEEMYSPETFGRSGSDKVIVE